MKLSIDFADIANDDILRQKRLQSGAEFLAGDVAFGCEVCHLSERMHAGIGAAGGHQSRLLASEFQDGRLNHRLHAYPIRLHLPADIM